MSSLTPELGEPETGEAPIPAARTARLASLLIDLGLLLVTPLVSTIVLAGLHRPANTTPPPDAYLQMMEGAAHQVPQRLLGQGWIGPLIVAAPAILFLLVQAYLLLRRSQTVGQAIVGVGWVRANGRPAGVRPVVRAAILLSLLCLAAVGHFKPNVVLWWLFLIPLPFASFGALFGLRAISISAEHHRAFEAPRFSAVAFIICTVGFALTVGAAALLFVIVSRAANLESTDIDVPTVAAGVLLPIGLLLTGALAAYRARRFIVGEAALMSLLVALIAFEAMVWDFLPAPPLQRFMVPGIIDWVVYALATYFGAVVFLILGSALGFMVSSDRGPDFSTRFERLVARRHLRLKLQHWVMLAVIATLAPILIYGVFIWPIRAVRRLMRGQKVARPLPPTVFMALLTIVGVMFGVTSLTVVLGVMGGFERDLKDKILGTTAQGIVQDFSGNFTDWRAAQKKILTVPGVAGATPFIYGEVMITTDDSVTGAVLHGIDADTNSQVTNLDRSISKGEGRLSDLLFPSRIPKHEPRGWNDDDDPPTHQDSGKKDTDKVDKSSAAQDGPVLPGIVIGREMAHSLNVWVGDQVTVMNPLGEPGPNGPIPRSLSFRVAAVFVTGMFEYDQKFAYIDLHEAQKFFRLDDSVTGIELRFKDVDEARPLMRQIVSLLGGFPYRGKDWGEMNQNLFSALRLERVVMFVLLSFQVLIACICVIATLVMLVIEKRKEVATLKAMGAREGSIMKLFVLEGVIIGGIGTFYGSAAGYLFCKLIEKFGVGLNPEIYYIERLPVVIEPSAFISVAAVAMILVFVATIYPARRGGSIAPVEGFREE